MSQSQPSSETAPPSAEEEMKRVSALQEKINLGAGNKEPDPATAENPPSDVRAGEKARTTHESDASRSERMDTGVSREENVDPESPAMHSGDQGS